MKQGLKNLVIGLTAAAAIATTGCSRPTIHESTYKIHFDNHYEWQDVGPGQRWHSPVTAIKKVSHKRQILEFPIDETYETADAEQATNAESIELAKETRQAIYTADGEIMLQEGIVAYNIKKDSEAVRSHFIDHRSQDMDLLREQIDGVVRTYLQTLDRNEIEAGQGDLGTEILDYLKNFKVNSTPEYDSSGNYVGNVGGYTIEDEWGIELTGFEPKRIRPPSLVLKAKPEGEAIIRKAYAEFESADDDARRRLERLKSLQLTIENIGDDSSVADYLSNAVVAEMLEQLGADNIGKLTITSGANGDMSPYTKSKLIK